MVDIDVTVNGLCTRKKLRGANTSGRVALGEYVRDDLRMPWAMHALRRRREQCTHAQNDTVCPNRVEQGGSVAFGAVTR